MAADSRRVLVCVNCKSRKKKCDKGLPSCGYCIKKELLCSYQSSNPAVRTTTPLSVDSLQNTKIGLTPRSSPVSCKTLTPLASNAIPAGLAEKETSLYHQVNGIIRSTGQFVDDISARYFRGIHRFMPIISRARFHSNLITLGATPSADFSILLLSMCLIVHNHDTRPARPGVMDQHSIHMMAKSLHAQLQATLPPSVYLIQAGLLVAMHEYADGQTDVAFASMAAIARMAYAARIHTHLATELKKDDNMNLEVEEATNTWWGLVIWERAFIWEVTVPDQPLVTIVPDRDSLLPTESETLDQSDVADPTSVFRLPACAPLTADVGGFGRIAQVTLLSDRILKAFRISDFTSRLKQLEELDLALQSLVRVMLCQQQGKSGVYCWAVAIAIRVLFALHQHVLDMPKMVEIEGKTYQLPENSFESSRAARCALTKMTLDIADSHWDMAPHLIDILPPSYTYMVRVALIHIKAGVLCHEGLSQQDAEQRLRRCLTLFSRRWGVDDFEISDG